MARPAPSAEEQLDFLAKVERILARGQFNTTYKFALLIALTNIAVERGDDSGDPLVVDLDDIARQFLEIYWGMARPYPLTNAILQQSTNPRKPARIITMLESEVRESRSSHQRLRVYRKTRDKLISGATQRLKRDVLYRLHTLGKQRDSSDADRFIYDQPATKTDCADLSQLTLNPGTAACLRRLRGVITAMVQSRWALWVRENNDKLAADRQLEEFLFGASRTNVAVYAERFYDMQDGRCFYSGVKLAGPGAGEVDHFIPWARYPFDSPFNLVLASRKINNSMRDELKPVEWRSAWLARNESAFAVLTAPEPKGFGAAQEDAATARSISAWIYGATRVG